MPYYFTQDPSLPQGFSTTFKKRFWKYVNKNGPVMQHCPELGPCWTWTGAKSSGYGVINRGGANGGLVRATLASKLLNGDRVEWGLWALHKCDNPSCVNPDHIFWGTQFDNMRDAAAKGRLKDWKRAYGENHGNTKFGPEAVLDIRQSQLPTKFLAKKYGVHISTIHNILRFKTWSYLR